MYSRRLTSISPSKQFADGHTEINFVDSYKYNIAAYNLSELLGIDDMIPVYVERKWQGNAGSISWLVSVMMDEQERSEKKLSSPDPDAWNSQMYKIRVFDELVYDTDANLTNVLIGRRLEALESGFQPRISSLKRYTVRQESRPLRPAFVRETQEVLDSRRTHSKNERPVEQTGNSGSHVAAETRLWLISRNGSLKMARPRSYIEALADPDFKDSRRSTKVKDPKSMRAMQRENS